MRDRSSNGSDFQYLNFEKGAVGSRCFFLTGGLFLPHVGGPALAVFVCCTLHTRGAYSTGAFYTLCQIMAKCAPLHAKMTQHDFCTMVRRKVDEEKGGGNCNRSWDVCCSLFSHRKHFVANSFKSEERMQRLKLLTPTPPQTKSRTPRHLASRSEESEIIIGELMLHLVWPTGAGRTREWFFQVKCFWWSHPTSHEEQTLNCCRFK